MKDLEKEFKPTTWSINNRTSIFVLTIIITLTGIMSYNSLPKEKFPDIVIPTIYVSTINAGTSPQDIENLITKPIEKETIIEALKIANLDASLIDAYDSKDFDQDLRDSTKAALDLVGSDVGTPVISVEGVAFFGPVITPAPKGAEALKLWDGVVAVASVPGFFELKRTRTARPQF